MSRWPRRQAPLPGLNLASLPDLIFTVLFFFMVVTHMRQVTPHVSTPLPQGSDLETTSRSAVRLYVLIGRPVGADGQPIAAADYHVQLGDQLIPVMELGSRVSRLCHNMSDDARRQLVVTIRADRDTPMALIDVVKQQLRQAGALRVDYVATNKQKTITGNK